MAKNTNTATARFLQENKDTNFFTLVEKVKIQPHFQNEEVLDYLLKEKASMDVILKMIEYSPSLQNATTLTKCREEVVLRFLGTQPSQEYMRTALEMCTHPTMMPVFEAWLENNPSEEEVERFKEYCKDFLAAYPEAAEKVNSL